MSENSETFPSLYPRANGDVTNWLFCPHNKLPVVLPISRLYSIWHSTKESSYKSTPVQNINYGPKLENLTSNF